MEYLTYADLKAKAQERTDTQDETFVTSDELLRYCQDAIDFCENKIHKFNVGDRYFETVAPLAITVGVRDYTLPNDIFGNKVTKLIYKYNNTYYDIKRLTKSNRYSDFHSIDTYSSSTQSYAYMLLNPSVNQKPVIRLTPRPGFSVLTYSPTITTVISTKTITVSDATGLLAGQFISSANLPTNTMIEIVNGTTVTVNQPATASASGTASTITNPDVLCYYLRNANKPTAVTDSIDIPEFSSYIVQYMVVEILKKDSGNPRFDQEYARLQELEQDMNSTLSEMISDQDDMMEVDASIYSETV